LFLSVFHLEYKDIICYIAIFQNFIKILPEKKGIEKNLWVKKFIKKVDYSREEIALVLYYKRIESVDKGISASGRAEENAGRNLDMTGFKKDSVAASGSSNRQIWLRGLDSPQTILIILPNTIHGCKRKDL